MPFPKVYEWTVYCTLRKQLRSFCLVMGSDREENGSICRQSGSVTYFTFSFWSNLWVTFLLLLTDKVEGKIWETAEKIGCCKKSRDCGVHGAAFQSQVLSWTKTRPVLQLSQLSKGLFLWCKSKSFQLSFRKMGFIFIIFMYMPVCIYSCVDVCVCTHTNTCTLLLSMYRHFCFQIDKLGIIPRWKKSSADLWTLRGRDL